MTIRRHAGGYYYSEQLAGEAWLEHGFGTAAAPPEDGYLVLKQIHSDIVLGAECCLEGVEGDALHTDRRGVRIAVKTADCVPLLLADPVKRAVAAVHAGWKGTLSGIAGRAVEVMGRAYGSRAEDLIVGMGPSIGLCCFEVGPEVASQFKTLFPERYDLEQSTKVDLREANFRILQQAGVKAERVDGGAPCTYCGGERGEFYSWRRDRVMGERMYAVIGVRD